MGLDPANVNVVRDSSSRNTLLTFDSCRNVKGVWWGCKVISFPLRERPRARLTNIHLSQYAILAMRNNPEEPSKGLRKGGSIINTASFGGHIQRRRGWLDACLALLTHPFTLTQSPAWVLLHPKSPTPLPKALF